MLTPRTVYTVGAAIGHSNAVVVCVFGGLTESPLEPLEVLGWP
jgi:hypothetical protein